MKKNYLSILLFLILFGNKADTLMAQPGKLDLSFGTSGKVLKASGTDDTYGEAVLVQPDGKIVVAGNTYGSSFSDFTVLRYTSNGTLDNTFNSDGIDTLDFSDADDFALAVALQPDGKIVVGGVVDSGVTSNIGIARYNSNGTIDNTFSGDGKAILRIMLSNVLERIDDIIVQPDGKIIGVGYSDNDIAIIRLNSDGSYDMNFNGKGWITIDIAGGPDAANSVALQSDGKIVVAGYAMIGSVNEFAMVRLKTDGTLDNTFSADGKTSESVAAGDNYAGGIAIQADGNIVIVGSVLIGGSDLQCAIMRIKPDGTLDNTFSGDGKLNHSILSSQDYLNNVLIQPDGKILAVGTAQDSVSYFALVRYNSNGTFDTSFDTTGIVTLSFGNIYSSGAGVALQPNNKIIVAGSAQDGSNISSMAVARYTSGLASSVKEHFITDTKIYPNPANDFVNLDYKLLESGTVNIQLTDMQGRTVLTVADNKQMEAGLQTETINLQSLSKGIYTLIVRTQNSEQSYLIIH